MLVQFLADRLGAFLHISTTNKYITLKLILQLDTQYKELPEVNHIAIFSNHMRASDANRECVVVAMHSLAEAFKGNKVGAVEFQLRCTHIYLKLAHEVKGEVYIL